MWQYKAGIKVSDLIASGMSSALQAANTFWAPMWGSQAREPDGNPCLSGAHTLI